ncbi:hypothetical protein JNUCC42_06005 [Brevibacterium sp. JNUCC-42]|nr:hypothetical protein JNUCC42_06005 [Brevibacterium sp. JNUCC-42]
MAVLGAIMNYRSTNLLTDKLVPTLEKLPPEAGGLVQQFEGMIKESPQGVYSMLLSPETLEKIPIAIQNMIVPVLKTTLVDALHSVFLFGLIFVVLGALLSFFMGKIKLSDSKKEQTEE